MRIKKVKVTDSKIMIAYERPSNTGLFDEYSLSCSDPARPEFYDALKALAPYVIEMCELPDDYVSRIEVRGVSFSYSGDDETMGATIITQMRLEKSLQNLNLNTPHKRVESNDKMQKLSPECAAALGKLHAECVAYIRGERVQGQLFEVA